MPITPKLALSSCPETAVFRGIDQLLQDSEDLRRVLKTYRSWTDPVRDKLPFGIEQAPGLRITPDNSLEDFVTPDCLKGTLTIRCELIVKGVFPDDPNNLWHAVRRAIYGPNRLANLQTLQGVGLRGLVKFQAPRLVAHDLERGYIETMGAILADVDIAINV